MKRLHRAAQSAKAARRAVQAPVVRIGSALPLLAGSVMALRQPTVLSVIFTAKTTMMKHATASQPAIA